MGLITTDGSLSKDKRHIDFTSKDLDQVHTLVRILNLKNKICTKQGFKHKSCYRVQFGNVLFYKFLLNIGLMPNKSKRLANLDIPNRYFTDFLRGHLDGDGCTYSYFDPRWPNSFLFYTTFISGSKNHLEWISKKIKELYNVDGRLGVQKRSYNLRFAKVNSIILLNKIYYKPGIPCLERKRMKILKSLDIILSQAEVAKLVHAYA